MPAATRPYVNGYYCLDLDGVNSAMISEINGLSVKAEVIRLANAGGYRQNAQLGNLTIADCKMKIAGAMSQPLTDWIKAALDRNHLYKNGTIHAYDFNLKSASITQFTNALLTTVTFPTCDAASKDPAYVGINFAVETVRHLKGDDSHMQRDLATKQKLLRTDSFKFVVDKIGEDSCSRVNKIDPIEAKMQVQRDTIGNGREYTLVPGAFDALPTIKVTFPTVHADPWHAWHEDFVIKGNCGAEQETSAELVWLDQTLKKELMRLTFKQVGIFNLESSMMADNKTDIHRVSVEMYMEDLVWSFSG